MRVEKTVVIDASREDIWELISDPCDYPRFMSGLTGVKLKSPDRASGMGARYQVHFRIGSAEVGGLVELVEWDEPADLAWTSVTGIDQRLRWRLRGPGWDPRSGLRADLEADGGGHARSEPSQSEGRVRRRSRRSE